MTYSVTSVSTPAWRMLHPKWQRAPFSGEGARRFGGRWNMKGWPALYLSTDVATAVAEYLGDLTRPGMLTPYRLDAPALADLTDGKGGPADERIRQAMTSDWDRIAKQDGAVPPSWELAHVLIERGVDGVLVPSARNVGGANVVLWRWHDAAGPGEGAGLTLLDPERALAGR